MVIFGNVLIKVMECIINEEVVPHECSVNLTNGGSLIINCMNKIFFVGWCPQIHRNKYWKYIKNEK